MSDLMRRDTTQGLLLQQAAGVLANAETCADFLTALAGLARENAEHRHLQTVGELALLDRATAAAKAGITSPAFALLIKEEELKLGRTITAINGAANAKTVTVVENATLRAATVTEVTPRSGRPGR